MRVCRAFSSTGNCPYGSKCRFSHDIGGSSSTTTFSSPSPPREGNTSASGPVIPCQYFQRHGRCRFGDDCNFSHDPNLPKVVEDPNSAESLYRGWSYLLGKRNTPARVPSRELTTDQVEKFLTDALRILDVGTTETIQQLIRDLGSDFGLHRILQIVEGNFSSAYTVRGFSFKRHCIPFLKIVAHEEMKCSLILEREVGTIFNFIYGHNGQRGTTFFKEVAAGVSQLSESGDRELFEEALSAATSALFHTLNMNQSASVQEAFKSIVETLSECAASSSSSSAFNFTFRTIAGELSRIKTLLNMADGIPRANFMGSRRPVTHTKLEYRQEVDFPGELSREGPRHDNDHADISLVQILPSAEEILSHRNEFLPQRSLDSPHHLEGIARVLDFQFRLLREDTSGQLREAVRIVHESWEELMEIDGKKDKKRKQKSGANTLFYKNAQIEKVAFAARDGLVLTTTFDQPSRVEGLKDKARFEWWSRSKSMAIGSLLCLVDSSKRSTFLVVCHREVRKGDWPLETNTPPSYGGAQDLASDPNRCLVKLRFAGEVSESDLVNIFDSIGDSQSGDTTRMLVEFPGLLFASFEPVLKTIKQLSKTVNLPFQKWLAPSPVYEYTPGADNRHTVVPPPLYITKPGVELDLTCITKSVHPLKYSVDREFSLRDLETHTTLDRGQCEAMIASLSQEFALIQGPPGTGKSYLGVQLVKVLIANREKTKIGPIICVCYTNHALDQFLQHLLNEGIGKIIRIGSRKKLPPSIEPFCLQTIAKTQAPTKLEKHEIGKARHRLEEVGLEMDEVCNQLFNPYDLATLKRYLNEHHHEAFRVLFLNEEDEAGFRRQRNRRWGEGGVIEDWVYCRGAFITDFTSNRSVDELLETDTSILLMSYQERLKLRQYWLDNMREVASNKLLHGITEHGECRSQLSKQYQEQERRCLQDCHIIGVTTTGFASRSELIRSLQAKVLICEEAAEVLEAHVLTALLPTLEHTILIGDHLQLRPQIMNHDFSMENPRGGQLYGLNTSLFERTAEYETYGEKRFPIAKLDTQRRMHPSISSLIRNTLYPALTDHTSTMKNPTVPGMAKRLFWMDHRQLESGADKMELIQTSHENKYEVDMVVGLVRHLSRQGFYKSGEIAVLTPYLRQMFSLRRKLDGMFDVVMGDKDEEQLELELELEESKEDAMLTAGIPPGPPQEIKKGNLLNEVRLATVDNFQGEEAKVVIISLVRSNDIKKCGFLATPNRINVLLSRAQDGMYIFGNAKTCSGVKMWSQIIDMLEKEGNINETLELLCPRHPDTSIHVTGPDDFLLFSPEGGCNERCEWRLNCGHPCVKKCHSDMLHKNTVCLEACERSFKHCDHPCPKSCGAECGLCMERVPGELLPCGHVSSSLRCFERQNLAAYKCRRKVRRELPCGHVRDVECYKDMSTYRCDIPCGASLPCGHECKVKCLQCKKVTRDMFGREKVVVDHGVCKVKCGRDFTGCRHSCTTPCHGAVPCKPCSAPCEVRCAHSRCAKKCSEPCAPCVQMCLWSCKHRGDRCDMPCAVPCDINPCSQRCEQQLPCSHQCPSVCGEECPSERFCQNCASDSVLDRTVDLITLETYREIDLDQGPVIFPSCGHFYTMETYDGNMEMRRAYHYDHFGNIIGPRPLDGSDEPANEDTQDRIKVKNCPDCRAPLRNINRYNRIVKSASLDEATHRFCTTSQVGFVNLSQEVSEAEDLLEANRTNFLKDLELKPKRNALERNEVKKFIDDRVAKQFNLNKRLLKYISGVREEEQPYCKVRRLVVNAERRKELRTSFVVDSSMVQLGFRLKGQTLLLQLRWICLWDNYTISESPSMPDDAKSQARKKIVKDLKALCGLCESIIDECQSTSLEKYECEARIYQAQFFALYRTEVINDRKFRLSAINPAMGVLEVTQSPIPKDAGEEDVAKMRSSLDRCELLCNKLPGTVGPLRSRVGQARKLLAGGTFYQAVSPEERRLVHLAMAAEFSSTGRWYTCPNGHPFTIGDCGMARETAPCPECGLTIGGEGYVLAPGVQRSQEFAEYDHQHVQGNVVG